VRHLPLPLALTARLSPVAVLAVAGWALASGPSAAKPAADHQPDQQTPTQPSASAPSSTAASKTYTTAPSPCDALPKTTITSLVPGAKTAGKEIPSTDTKLRRTCSWNALKGYDYRWLDVSYELSDSVGAAQSEYEQQVSQNKGGGDVPGVGDSGYSEVNLTTQDKQQTRQGVVVVRVDNALVLVTYNGSNFETKKAPGTDEINKGAIQAARAAVSTLQGGAAQH
jgi:hypothetical protein